MEIKPPFKTLHVITDSHPFGGAQRNTWLSVSKSAPEFTQSLASGQGREYKELCNELGIPYYSIPGLTNDFNPWGDIQALFYLQRLMKREKIKIAHMHSTKAGIIGRIAAKLAGVPLIVFTIHGVSFDFELRPRSAPILLQLEKAVAKITDGIVSVAENCKQTFIDNGVCAEDKIRVIYSAIEFEPIDNADADDELYKSLSLNKDHFIIGAVGHFRKAKGYEYLVEAAPIIVKNIPNARILIVGDGPEKSAIEKMIKEASLEKYFVLTGSRDDIPRLLKIMNLFCRPSIHEGLGRALTEAMYAKIPPVVTDIWGTREVCEDGVTGILVPIRDPAALAEGIIKLKENPKLAESIGEAARKKTAAIFGVETMVRGIEEYYLEIMKKKGIIH